MCKQISLFDNDAKYIKSIKENLTWFELWEVITCGEIPKYGLSVKDSDVIMAIVSNPDRITEIEKTMNEVIEEKGWTK